MEHHITTPATPAQLAHLRVGDKVRLSGTVFTARDAAHQRMVALLDQGEPLPFPIRDAAIYYVGPTPTPPGRVAGSAGPTTSGRMDAYAPRLLALGQSIMIGKGARSPEVLAAARQAGAIYLAALGGAGALMAAGITAMEPVCWPELGCEAVVRLTVADLPLTVALDSAGNDLYVTGPQAYLASLK